MYDEFVESFKTDDERGGKTFVRGGVVQPGGGVLGCVSVVHAADVCFAHVCGGH